MLIIHLAAVVLHPIADHQVVDMQQQVVGGGLVEDFLADGHRGSLILDEHARLGLMTIKDAVTTKAFLAHLQFHFVGQHRRGISQMLHQVMHKMLAHPFLWRQRYVFPAQIVENHRLARPVDNFCGVGWQVESIHFIIFAVYMRPSLDGRVSGVDLENGSREWPRRHLPFAKVIKFEGFTMCGTTFF